MFEKMCINPGELSNILLSTKDVDFILKDDMIENHNFIQYKIFASCVRVNLMPQKFGLLDYWFCWGFQYYKKGILRIRGWNPSDNDIFIIEDFTGIGIGTIVMNLIIQAIKILEIPKEASVKQMRLSVWDADEENKQRRNKFYKNFGFELFFKDNEQKVGRAIVSCVGDLKTYQTNKPYQIQKLSKVLMDRQSQIFKLNSNNYDLKKQLTLERMRCEKLSKKLAFYNPINWLSNGSFYFFKYVLLFFEFIFKLIIRKIFVFKNKKQKLLD